MKTIPSRSVQSHSARLLGLAATTLVLCAGTAVAQDQQQITEQQLLLSLQEQAVDVIMPQRRVRPGINGYVTAISGVDVDVRLTDTLATTHIEITVENKSGRTTQARLVLPVPQGSTIRTFGIDGIGDEPTAKLLPRDEAASRYQEIVSKMIDPGLLEFVGSAMIQSSVFPVEPGASRTMTIVYEQSLNAHDGRVEYVLPRSASYAGSDIQWNLSIELESSGQMGPVFSPSHPIVSDLTSAKSMKVGVPNLNEPGAFRLYAMLADEQPATTMLYADPKDPDSGYFMFVADAPEIDQAVDTIPREMTIVIDRSGSMGGKKIEQARESAKQVVAGMRMGEYVRIVDYSDDVRSFSDQAVELTAESLPMILDYIDRINARGGTNLHGALVESLSAQVTHGHLPMVLFMTDGLATIGVTGESEIRKAAQDSNTHDRRVFSFGLGFDVNVPLLDGLAMDTRAESTFVKPNEDVEMKVGQVFDKLDGPIMIDPVFESAYAVSEAQIDLRLIQPDTIGDLFSGSRIIILGKYHNLLDEPAHMWIRPEDESGTTITLDTEFEAGKASNRYAFIARLWAQKRIDSLINQIRLAGADGSQPDQELVDEIVRLSLEHGVMSEYTAFLAEEEMGIELANARTDDGRLQAATESRRAMTALNSERSGTSGYSQYANRQDAVADQIQAEMDEGGSASGFMGTVQSGTALKSNLYYDSNMDQIAVNTIQRGQGATLYRKTNRWVDAQLGEHAGEEPEITVEFATDAYWDLMNDLVGQDRQWILANRGDIYFENHSQRVLVRNPK